MAFAAPLVALAGPISTALGIGAGVVGAASAISQGNYASAVAKNNAKIAAENAAKASEAAQKEAQRSSVDYAAQRAALIASQAASGLDLGSRSFVQSRMLERRVAGQAGVDIANQGATAAQQLLQDSANYRAEASSAKTQGYLNAAGTLLSTAGNAIKPTLAGRRTGKRMPWEQSPNWSTK